MKQHASNRWTRPWTVLSITVVFSLLYLLLLPVPYNRSLQKPLPSHRSPLSPLAASIEKSLLDPRWEEAALSNMRFFFPLPPSITSREEEGYSKVSATLLDKSVPWQIMTSLTEYAPSFALPDSVELLKETLIHRLETLEMIDFHFIENDLLQKRLPERAFTLFSATSEQLQMVGLIDFDENCLVECYLFVDRLADEKEDTKDVEELLVQAVIKILGLDPKDAQNIPVSGI